MNATELHERSVAGLALSIELFGSSGSGEVLTYPGVAASVSPQTPQRSIFNSVSARDETSLANVIDDIAGHYESSGVRAWTAWVPDFDRPTANLLEQRGHVLDGSPRSMGLDLDELRVPERPLPDGVELVPLDLDRVGRINDLAYGIEGPGWSAAIGGDTKFPLRSLGAVVGNQPVSCAIAIEGDDDVVITGVATDPAHQGKGLAAAIITELLSDSQRRGMRTSTLQASAAGAPVYERLGYSDLGYIELWELRKPD